VAANLHGSGRGLRDDHAGVRALQRMVCAVLNAPAASRRAGPRAFVAITAKSAPSGAANAPSDSTSKVSPRSNSSLKLQVSIHSRLLTMASQRRYNQPNITDGCHCCVRQQISLAFHERRCGVATSLAKQMDKSLLETARRAKVLGCHCRSSLIWRALRKTFGAPQRFAGLPTFHLHRPA
jgi:hypothetical protein